VPTGVDLEDFSPRPCNDAFETSLGLPPAARIISKIALVRDWKRQDVLVDVAPLLGHCAEIQVLIAGRGGLFIPGEGRLRVDLERQIERVGLLGHVDDVRPLLSCTDVLE
jgi:glycosyltransferase involved in cell wall biosynthesis